VLVVANLGTATLNGVTVGSDTSALAPGQYTPKSVLGSARAAQLSVGSDGRVGNYVPVAILEPMTTYIFDLAPARH
jgi:hypothetical protein